MGVAAVGSVGATARWAPALEPVVRTARVAPVTALGAPLCVVWGLTMGQVVVAVVVVRVVVQGAKAGAVQMGCPERGRGAGRGSLAEVQRVRVWWTPVAEPAMGGPW